MSKLMGLGASKGTATGMARFPDDANFKDGDILVANMTVPENVPVMRRASAVATDIGSITCHASVVSMELGIPCVVRTKEITKHVGKVVTVSVKAMKDAYVEVGE